MPDIIENIEIIKVSNLYIIGKETMVSNQISSSKAYLPYKIYTRMNDIWKQTKKISNR